MTDKRLTIKLDWPSKTLNPNARVHWTVKRMAVKSARQFACFTALASKQQADQLPDGELNMFIDFYSPDNRKRDDDNLIASFKPYRDGIADALGIDDNRFVCQTNIMMGVYPPKGYVLVTITGRQKA